MVFNTEAHPFPRFELGKLFTTGWQRKPRDQDGHIIPEAKPNAETRAEQAVPTEVKQVVVEDVSKGKQLTENDPKSEESKAQDAAAAGNLDPITGKEKDDGR